MQDAWGDIYAPLETSCSVSLQLAILHCTVFDQRPYGAATTHDHYYSACACLEYVLRLNIVQAHNVCRYRVKAVLASPVLMLCCFLVPCVAQGARTPYNAVQHPAHVSSDRACWSVNQSFI